MSTNASISGVARFRVSDVVPVPLRGYMLRLRVTEGDPTMALLRPGRSLRLIGPDGSERVVLIHGIGATSGRARADRLERLREIDVVVSAADGEAVRIGWTAEPAG
ncbi:MAG: hypothetical protein DIU52_003655 [bacterium]